MICKRKYYIREFIEEYDIYILHTNRSNNSFIHLFISKIERERREVIQRKKGVTCSFYLLKLTCDNAL